MGLVLWFPSYSTFWTFCQRVILHTIPTLKLFGRRTCAPWNSLQNQIPSKFRYLSWLWMSFNWFCNKIYPLSRTDKMLTINWSWSDLYFLLRECLWHWIYIASCKCTLWSTCITDIPVYHFGHFINAHEKIMNSKYIMKLCFYVNHQRKSIQHQNKNQICLLHLQTIQMQFKFKDGFRILSTYCWSFYFTVKWLHSHNEEMFCVTYISFLPSTCVSFNQPEYYSITTSANKDVWASLTTFCLISSFVWIASRIIVLAFYIGILYDELYQIYIMHVYDWIIILYKRFSMYMNILREV